MTKQHIALLCGFMLGAAALHAQQIPDLKIGSESVQFHGFISQGYMDSNDNNFLTAPTKGGTFAMTDFAFNANATLTDKLRIGAQMYDYNVGGLGNWQPTLDWGFLDFKAKDWLGIRAGKVKTALGLYNDTQDMTFLYTWALMPQAQYPLDLRAASISHIGADLYGHMGLKTAGSLDYTAYFGFVPFDPMGGSEYSSKSNGGEILNETQRVGGLDLHWNTPIAGLMIGNSVMVGNDNGYGVYPAYQLTFNFDAPVVRTVSSYADYVHKSWHFSGEFRFKHNVLDPDQAPLDLSSKSVFVGASYRFSKHLELGTYNSSFLVDHSSTPAIASTRHIIDQAVTARIDLTNYWNVKVEGHFMNGTGDVNQAQGFYVADNSNGFKPQTTLLVVRTGVNF